MFSIARNYSKKVLNMFSIARNQIRKVSDISKKDSGIPDTLSVTMAFFAGIGMFVSDKHEELHSRKHDDIGLILTIFNCIIGGNIGAACGFVVWTDAIKCINSINRNLTYCFTTLLYIFLLKE